MPARRTRFYLDKPNAKWMGVCSGIADYTGIDTLWVRIGTVVLTLLGGFPWTLIAYFIAAWLADDKPQAFSEESREETKFWQKVRARPGASIRDVRSRFRDIDRRLADVETVVTSQNSRLAAEIESLR